jgi:kumamolisin
MPAKKQMVGIPGSEKQPLPNARAVAAAPADERLEVTVRLRPRTPLPDAASMLQPSRTPTPTLTRRAYNARYAADPKDVARIRRFASAHHLTVVRESLPRRSVMLAGTVADFQRAFGVVLRTYAYPGGTYRGRVGPVRVPTDLAPLVEGVFGLDNRPVARRHFRIARGSPRAADGAHAFNPGDVAKLYNFPTGIDGAGQTVGIIELGGGYRPQDLETYLQGLGLPTPTVVPVSVDGATNAPSGDPGSDDGEVGLDIEVVAAIAPGAKIVVYFAPNNRTSKGFLDAITKAVHDDTNNPSVISISWGGPESGAGDGFQVQFDQVLQSAAMLGISVCVAAGDNGAADMGPKVWDGLAHVDFPGSSPFALACGGTSLLAGTSGISAETVWNQHAADVSADAGPDGSFGATGGGVSGAFPLPAYQQNANVPPSLNPSGYKGRGVPDVSGDADPASGYNVLVDGTSFVVGGTSAVAPLWAALIALLNQKLGGHVGFLNTQIYALPASPTTFHDVTVGDNRVTYESYQNVGYTAGPGWDPCSGLGSPNGAGLAQSLSVSTPTSSVATRPHRASTNRPPRGGARRAAKPPRSTRRRGAARPPARP